LTNADVMPAHAGIHVFLACFFLAVPRDVDARHKAGHEE
jgi:hypothetical protein